MSTNTQTQQAYIGRCKCGVMVCAMIDSENHKTEIAREVSKWIRQGLTVERMPVEDARPLFGQCQCKDTDITEARHD